MALVLINCAGDTDLAKRLYDFLASTYPTIKDMMSLNEAEITVKSKTLPIKNNEVKETLSKFQASNPDLAEYSVMQFGNVFTIGIPQSADKLVFSCELCGYLTRDEEDLTYHKKIIHTSIGFSA